MTKPLSSPCRGYIEGYYGRLLNWAERRHLTAVLADTGMNTYLYAPKEDPAHRFHWRQDWDADWWQNFAVFTADAAAKDVAVIAGIAPGLDFDFASLSQNTGRKDSDAAILIDKSRRLIDAGATSINLLMDDLDPGFGGHDGGYQSEGAAHADLANMLADQLQMPLSVTPRLYADEIAAEGETYLGDFTARLDPDMMVWTCGCHIVAPRIDLEATALARAGIATERMIVWDNLYAHDYCPRRLFLGCWQGRDSARHILINPTGLVHTDALLLHLMAAGENQTAWQQCFSAHGVPPAFMDIAGFFDLPPHPDAAAAQDPFDPDLTKTWLDALDTLLWRWKSPLQREWYPFLMGLRGDLLYRSGAMDRKREEKTFPPLIRPPAGALK